MERLANTTEQRRYCNQCRFSGMLKNPEGALLMVCRRHPPHVQSFAMPISATQLSIQTSTAWPAIGETDWCGEFEARADS